MVDFSSAQFSVFLVAAVVLAITPGPGITYVAARTASGGKRHGLASTIGTSLGGLVHVIAAAFGLSVLIAESATIFNIVKYLGACYLLYLGIQTLRTGLSTQLGSDIENSTTVNVFWQGVVVEAFNVKTALFFLAFIPQFVDPQLPIVSQFVVYGTICVVLITGMDLGVVFSSMYIVKKLNSARSLNIASGVVLVLLGLYVALAENLFASQKA